MPCFEFSFLSLADILFKSVGSLRIFADCSPVAPELWSLAM